MFRETGDGIIGDAPVRAIPLGSLSTVRDSLRRWAYTAMSDDEDAPVPAVTGVSVSSDAGADRTYVKDDIIQVTVTFSKAVVVTGSPQPAIDMDPAEWGTKWAEYHSGSGTSSLVFVHTVVEPNLSTQGIAVLANTLSLNSGTIQSEAEVDADLAHDGLAHDTSRKVDWEV